MPLSTPPPPTGAIDDDFLQIYPSTTPLLQMTPPPPTGASTTIFHRSMGYRSNLVNIFILTFFFDEEEEVFNPPENGEVAVAEEEELVPEVVDEVQEASQLVESDTKIEEVTKKSYASIVMDLKQSVVPFSSPAPVRRKPQP